MAYECYLWQNLQFAQLICRQLIQKQLQLHTAENNKVIAKANAKESGNTKLLGLGLSQEEATALTGYTPE